MYMHPNCDRKVYIHISAKELKYTGPHYKNLVIFHTKHNCITKVTKNLTTRKPNSHMDIEKVIHKEKPPDILAWLHPIGSTKAYK